MAFQIKFRSHRNAIQDRKCKRCGLLISIKHVDCPHCSQLSKLDMDKMLNNRNLSQGEKNRLVVGLMVVVSVLLVLVIIVD